MNTYIINYHTGVGNQEVTTNDIQEVKELAKQGINYTQENVTIEDLEGNILLIARWYGIKPEQWEIEENLVLEEIGNGYYSIWEDA